MTELLKVNNLATHFKTESGLVKAVDGVSYYIIRTGNRGDCR